MNALAAGGAERFALLIGLSLFFGFAFEGYYADELPSRPGGVRTFPLLAIAGGALYLLEPHYAVAFVAGLLVLGAWIYAYLRREFDRVEVSPDGAFIVPIANVLAFVLGPIALTQPLWIGVTVAVGAVLLLSGKTLLHDWARRVPSQEVVTAGQFLILVGIVLPLLAGRPPIPFTSITPLGVWLAVIAVSSISYASYLLQHYVFPGRSVILMAVLGGLYSSTATTVVLARRSREEGMSAEFEAGILAASAMMYVRILVVCALFSLALARLLFVPMIVLSAVTLGTSRLLGRSSTHTPVARPRSENPLQLGAAFTFAALMVVVSVVTGAVQTHLGGDGVLGLAAVVGVTDVDPFVLSLAQGGAGNVALSIAALAIVIATSSNNVLKAIYTLGFSRARTAWVPAAVLVGLAAGGAGLGFALLR